MQSLCCYFPGGNTPEGFFSYYDEILNHSSSGKVGVIKGGPGTGKSTFLKQLGETLANRGETVTYLHCSSDPNSLDGVFLPEHNSLVVDGTSPHIKDPRYPGAYDTLLNFCEFIGDISEGKTVLLESEQAKTAFSEGYCYLKGAKAMLDLMLKRSESALMANELRSFAFEIAGRVSSYPATGCQKTVFLSAITADGCKNFLKENLDDYHVIAIEAQVGDATYRLLETVKTACHLRNADMIACPCPMNPKKTEHLIFPSANLALVTSNLYHDYWGADEIVNFSDFLATRTQNRTPQMMYDGMLELAIQTFSSARDHHNQLESVYKRVTDYSAIGQLFQRAVDFLIS